MIDSSFMTTLPDMGFNQQFIILAVNNWDKEYERVFPEGSPATATTITTRKLT